MYLHIGHSWARAVILVFIALCFSLPFVLQPGVSGGAENWLFDAIRPRPTTNFDIRPPAPPIHEYYQWPTTSQFNPISYDFPEEVPLAELCSAFPAHVLNYIQPILKTGHKVLHQRLPPHFQSISACLTNVLIFSDLAETYQGRRIIDVIADIPSHLQHWPSTARKHIDQLESYTTLQELASNHTLETADLSALHGWKTDKFKFLPAISRAWRMHPEKRWYFFYEDDTYVSWDNVFRMLEHFDPDLPWYFGSPAPDRKPAPDQPKVWFGYGGPGFVLSRATMHILVEHDWDAKGKFLGSKVTEEWWDKEVLKNCCGDSILGWVLWNKAVPLSGMWPLFSPLEPHLTTFSDSYWCKPVLSMHKPKVEDMLGLWLWEWEHRTEHRPLLFRDMAMTYFKFADLATRDDWDNHNRQSYRAPNNGTLYSYNPHESFESCKAACEAMPGCLQYMHHLHICKLSNAMSYGSARAPEIGTVGKDLVKAESEMKWNSEQLRFRSGWVQDKIRSWIDSRPCEEVHWVRPSTERVF